MGLVHGGLGLRYGFIFFCHEVHFPFSNIRSVNTACDSCDRLMEYCTISDHGVTPGAFCKINLTFRHLHRQLLSIPLRMTTPVLAKQASQ